MRVSVHVPDPVGEEVKKYADKEGVSVSQFYAQAAEAALSRRKREEAHARISRLVGSASAEKYPRRPFDEAQRAMRRDDPRR